MRSTIILCPYSPLINSKAGEGGSSMPSRRTECTSNWKKSAWAYISPRKRQGHSARSSWYFETQLPGAGIKSWPGIVEDLLQHYGRKRTIYGSNRNQPSIRGYAFHGQGVEQLVTGAAKKTDPGAGRACTVTHHVDAGSNQGAPGTLTGPTWRRHGVWPLTCILRPMTFIQ